MRKAFKRYFTEAEERRNGRKGISGNRGDRGYQAMRKAFKRYFTEAEERQLFRTVGNVVDIHARRDYAWMRLLRQTGIRVETLAGLNVHDAQDALASKYLDLRPEITKGNRGGRIFITRKARAAFKDLLAIHREMGHGMATDSPLIFSRKHRRMSVRSFEARTRHWCNMAGLEDSGTPHWFRHTLAKRIMKNSTAEDPRGVVQVALTHASINSTAVYTLPDKEDVERAMEEAS